MSAPAVARDAAAKFQIALGAPVENVHCQVRELVHLHAVERLAVGGTGVDHHLRPFQTGKAASKSRLRIGERRQHDRGRGGNDASLLVIRRRDLGVPPQRLAFEQADGLSKSVIVEEIETVVGKRACCQGIPASGVLWLASWRVPRHSAD
jgi:hypothetical protein